MFLILTVSFTISWSGDITVSTTKSTTVVALYSSWNVPFVNLKWKKKKSKEFIINKEFNDERKLVNFKINRINTVDDVENMSRSGVEVSELKTWPDHL